MTPVHAPDPRGSVEVTPETLEQYADRVAATVRRSFMEKLDDDVIGKLGRSHIIFGKACVMEAIGTAMRESERLASLPQAGEDEVVEALRGCVEAMSYSNICGGTAHEAAQAALSTLRTEQSAMEEVVEALRAVQRCRMEAGEGRFVHLANLRVAMDQVDAALAKLPQVKK